MRGEKQCVATARAFLISPKLLVCDETTSSLCTAAEQEIMTSLARLAEGMPTIFLVHRLSTIQNCDKVIVLSVGRIIEAAGSEELGRPEQACYDKHCREMICCGLNYPHSSDWTLPDSLLLMPVSMILPPWPLADLTDGR